LYQGTPRSSRKPYQRQGHQRLVTGTAARLRAQRIKLRDKFTCQNKQCHVVTHRLQCDHRIPVAYGGDESDANCQSLCEACHAVKSKVESQGMQLPDPSDFPTTYREAKTNAIGSQCDDGVDVSELFTTYAHVNNSIKNE
jgi:5-methylcytosine-specific restriction endonuclease McrA